MTQENLYKFDPEKGLGDLSLDYSENQIINLLGEPDSIERTTGNKCYSTELEYKSLDINILIDFDEFAENQYDIHIRTNKLFFNNISWDNLKKSDILKTIKTIFKQKGITYLFEHEIHDFTDYKFEEYNFENIGLTVYFEANRFDGAVVYKPIAVEKETQPELKTYQLEPLETDLLMVSEPKTEYKRTKK